MKVAVLSDIHANELALQAVLGSLQDVDQIWCLGDVVGYGPHPLEVVQEIRARVEPDNWVMGNHEEYLAKFLVGRPASWDKTGDNFGEEAEKALKIHLEAVRSDSGIWDFFEKIFRDESGFQYKMHCLDGACYVLTHASLVHNPIRYVYPWRNLYIDEEFQHLQKIEGEEQRRILLTGHSHVPLLAKKNRASDDTEVLKVEPDVTYKLDADMAFINPGSVGQPRDLDTRASYAVLDTEANTVVFRRVPYDHPRVTRDLAAKYYPFSLQQRLIDAPLPNHTPRDWEEHFRRLADRHQ